MIQWHPIFAQLLRPLVESHYEVMTEVPVGDAPRSADIVLLRRTSAGDPPFQGLWRFLTTWNVVEFKGPTVSARVADLDALLELGLGIHRRLNAERAKELGPTVNRSEMSFWYLANHLGKRFLREAEELLGGLEPEASGVWRASAWRRPFLLVSAREVAVERDSFPVHLLTREPVATEQAMIRVFEQNEDLWELYGGWLVTGHQAVSEELARMARTRTKRSSFFDFRPVIEHFGWQEIIRQTGLESLVEQIGAKGLVSKITPEQRRELLLQLQAVEKKKAEEE